MNEFVGKQLGNYRLIRLLGQGGFADVYLGEHIYLNTLAAIKLLQARLANNDLEVFLREARAISSLVHPNIVRVLEFGVEGNIPFLVMDYAPNGTLRQRYPEGTRLSPATIVPYVRQVAGALQYAHDRNVIHRDLKPENMLVGQNNDILLSDFGIAVVSQSARYQSTQDVVGTIAYMAPEQLNGRPVPASDQYALGVVVYAWLSGELPYRGSFAEVGSQHMFASPVSLRGKVPGITPAIDEVVLTALAKDPQQRFMRIQAFANAFEQASKTSQSGQFILPSPPLVIPPSPQSNYGNAFPVQGSSANPNPRQTNQLPPNFVANQPGPGATPDFRSAPQSQPNSFNYGPGQPDQPTYISNRLGPPSSPNNGNATSGPVSQTDFSPPPGNPQPAKGGVSRRAVLIGLAGVAGVAVLGGGIALAVLSQQHGSPASAPTPTPVANGNTPAATSTAAATDTTTPGSGAETTPTAQSSPTSVTNGAAVTYSGHAKYITAVVWSPDGTKVASASGDNTVQVWNASNATNFYTYSGHKNPVNTIAWSSDGKSIFSGSDDNTIQVWNAADGTKRFSYLGHTGSVRCLALSPDGKRAASGSDDGTVQVWDANSGNHFITHSAGTGLRALAWSPNGKRIASTKNDLVEVWDSVTGNTINTYNGHSGNNVNAVAWSQDGKHVASGSDDKTVQVWDAVSFSSSFNYPGHSQAVLAVAWSPDSKRIASGSADTTAQAWNASNGVNPFVYHGHSSPVRSIMWSPDGAHVVSGSGDPNAGGSDDHTAQVWQPQ